MSDVIVIGGGLAGCATAFYLAADGVAVTLLERSDLNTFASGSNAGSLHAQIPHDPFVTKGEAWARVFSPTIGLLSRSIAMWRELPAVLGTDLEIGLKGGLLVAPDERQMRDIERKVVFERAEGLNVELLDRPALRRLAPYLADHIVGGAFCPDEGKANPFLIAPAFAAAARRLGVEIRRHTDVRGIERERGGFAVTTDKGVFRAGRVVNAAGAEAGRIASMLGIDLADVQGFPIQASATEQVGPLVPHLLYYTGEKLTLKQNGVGTLLIGGGWPARPGRHGVPIADPVSLARNLAVAVSVVPALAGVRVVRTWAAIVNGTDDWKPILGEMPGAPGFFVNFFPWMGFTAGPIAARIVASMVQGRTPPVDVDLTPFLPGH
ncbi:NAD(P)/FAD-dependent oxidoreductase [Labrys monachus]|uniref:Glycine/D-amino acid oxidase-like deaminating enzyme n=1 Tax=Labrys monachus TaxID=217067 RepID=A0ABU0F7B9_9HYPH|nr:FAD-binding oxidoreductase [Labrys monachus]MDQ0390505.1 glycine/D-amino acid oxidase-like deaminating enzyme [Labrys monachus]